MGFLETVRLVKRGLDRLGSRSRNARGVVGP